MTETFLQTVPTLRIFSVNKAREFYASASTKTSPDPSKAALINKSINWVVRGRVDAV